MTCGNYLIIKLVDEHGDELDKIGFSKDKVNGALDFAKSIVGFIPKMTFGNKLDILPLMSLALTKGLGGVVVWKIEREIYEKEVKPLLENLKG